MDYFATAWSEHVVIGLLATFQTLDEGAPLIILPVTKKALGGMRLMDRLLFRVAFE